MNISRRSMFGFGFAAAGAVSTAEALAKSIKTGLRVSSDKDDPSYAFTMLVINDEKAFKVFLNGEEMPWVDAADENEGWVRFAVPSRSGEIMAGVCDDIVTKTLHGDVYIEIVEQKNYECWHWHKWKDGRAFRETYGVGLDRTEALIGSFKKV